MFDERLLGILQTLTRPHAASDVIAALEQLIQSELLAYIKADQLNEASLENLAVARYCLLYVLLKQRVTGRLDHTAREACQDKINWQFQQLASATALGEALAKYNLQQYQIEDAWLNASVAVESPIALVVLNNQYLFTCYLQAKQRQARISAELPSNPQQVIQSVVSLHRDAFLKFIMEIDSPAGKQLQFCYSNLIQLLYKMREQLPIEDAHKSILQKVVQASVQREAWRKSAVAVAPPIVVAAVEEESHEDVESIAEQDAEELLAAVNTTCSEVADEHGMRPMR